MKWIISFAVIVFLTLFVITGKLLGSLNVLPDRALDSYVTRVVLNRGSEPLALYAETGDEHRPVGHLLPEAILPFAYRGETRRWLYGFYQGKVVVIRRPEAVMAFHLGGRYLLPEVTVRKIMDVSFVIFLATIMIWHFLLRRQARQRYRTLEFEADALTRTLAESHQNTTALKLSLDHKAREIRRLEDTLRHKTQEHERSHAALTALSHRQGQELQKLRDEMDQAIEQESAQRLRVSLQDMQDSYDRLKAKYDQCIEEAKLFGADFQSDKYDRVLSGRCFEIFVATQFSEHAEFEILEWAPDKGYVQGIWVKSTGNPDLVFGHPELGKVAVECKYRSTSTVHEKASYLLWASLSQATRYQAFSEERGIPVFIALGFDGDATVKNPSEPGKNYLFPLAYGREKSVKGFYFDADQYLITRQDVFDHYVNIARKQLYPDALIAKLLETA